MPTPFGIEVAAHTTRFMAMLDDAFRQGLASLGRGLPPYGEPSLHRALPELAAVG